MKVRAGRRSIEVGNPTKVLYPDDGITKAALVEYYSDIASHMLPHLEDRPMTMQRFPDGIGKGGFYHKDAPGHFPDWIPRITVEKEGGTVDHVVCNDRATLVYLANQACITPHIWLSRTGALEYPDRMVFDLDPSDDDFEDVRRAARATREVLDELDLPSFPMTSGSRGIHLVVPLRREVPFEKVRDFARGVARVVAARHPDAITVEVRKKKRKGRLLIDYFRNAYAQTVVAPYALRARAGAPVATPLSWDEIDDRRLSARRWSLRNIRRRLTTVDDPWRGMARRASSIGSRKSTLSQLLGDD